MKFKLAPVMVAWLLVWVAFVAASGAPHVPRKKRASDTQAKGKVVYVCACLQTRSCSCMTEAKTEGPCSCGTQGGPPMKAVPRDGAWAKANRKALAN